MNIIHDSNAGGRLGAALGSGLQALAEYKINQLNQQRQLNQTAKAYEQWLTPEDARATAQLSPQLQEKLLLGFLNKGGGRSDQTQDQQFNQGGMRQLNQQQAQQQPTGMQLLQNNRNPAPNASQAVDRFLLGQQGQPQQPGMGLGQENQATGAPQRKMNPSQRIAAEQLSKAIPVSPEQQQAQEQMRATPSRKRSLADVFSGSNEQAVADEKSLTPVERQYKEAADIADETVRILDQMEALWNTGKVRNGQFGEAEQFLNPNTETQQFSALGDALATMLVQELGTPTNAKIKFTREQKPVIGELPETQIQKIKRLRKEAEHRGRIAVDELPRSYVEKRERQRQRDLELAQQDMQAQQPQAQQQQQEFQPQESAQQQESPQQSQPSQNNPKEEEGWIDWAIRNVSRLHKNGFGSMDPLGLIPSEEDNSKWLSDLTGGKSDLSSEQKKNLSRWWDENKDYYSPKNFTEQVADSVVQNLPITILTSGGALGAGIIRDIVGSAASKTVENRGGGPVAQILSGIAAGGLTGKAINKFKGIAPSNLTSIAKDAEKKAYEKADKLGQGVTSKGTLYRHKLSELYNKVDDTTRLSTGEKDELLSKIRQWSGDVTSRGVAANKILERKQDINSLYSKFSGKGSRAAKDFLKEAQKAMFSEMESIGKSGHQDWEKAWKSGDAIKTALNYKPAFMDAIEEIPKAAKALKHPLAQILLGGGVALYKGSAKPLYAGLASAVAGTAIKKLIQVGAFALSEDPKVRRLVFDAMKATSERNVPEIIKSYTRVNNAVKKYDKFI